MMSEEQSDFKCLGRSDPNGECDWPVCGCDPKATRVIEVLRESGWHTPQDAMKAIKQLREIRAQQKGDYARAEQAEARWLQLHDYVLHLLNRTSAENEAELSRRCSLSDVYQKLSALDPSRPTPKDGE
jgi:hypothetical protein